MKFRRLTRFSSLMFLALVFASPRCAAQTVTATQADEKTIRIVVAGRFETSVTTVKGFGHVFYDLKHDPEKKRDIAPVFTEAGLLWTKMGVGGRERVGTANPPKKMELLESGPTRVRVRISGPMNRRGLGIPRENLEEVGFEQTFTIYPSGKVYVDYALVAHKPLELHHFLLILKPNGAWGSRGKGEGAGEVRCAGEFGPQKPYGKTASSLALEWTNGPTYFQDILMVMHKGRYNATYWNEGYQDKDLRCGLNVLSRWPDRKVAKGKDHIRLLLVFRDDINGHEAAKPYARDYRNPDKLDVTKGKLDGEGFDEAEGCYVLEAAPAGVAFTLHGTKVPRMAPAFKIKGWTGKAPRNVTLAGKRLTDGKDFTASVEDGVLLLQLMMDVKEDARIAISAN